MFSSEYCAVHDWVTGAGRHSYSIRRVIRDCWGGTIDLAADLVCREGVDSAADLVCREGVDSAAVVGLV